MCKFSIIVPCYNIENRAEDLFKMLHTKNYDDYEVILVDDCSKDNTYETLNRIAEKFEKFKVYKAEKNGGPGLARNLGLKHAKGKFIVFCDSDDNFDINVLDSMDKFLSENPESDMLVSPHSMLKGSKSAVVDTYKKYQNKAQVEKKDVVLGSLAPWGKVFRANIIREHRIEFPARQTGEDICFVVNYLVHCSVVCKLDVVYYGYVVSQSSITHKKSSDLNTTFDILQPIYSEHFPSIEVKMFAKNHLLTQAKHLTDNGATKKEIKKFFAEQNARYPNWIKHVEIEKESLYRRLMYKAMYYNRPMLIKAIMFMRRKMH